MYSHIYRSPADKSVPAWLAWSSGCKEVLGTCEDWPAAQLKTILSRVKGQLNQFKRAKTIKSV